MNGPSVLHPIAPNARGKDVTKLDEALAKARALLV